MKARRIITLIVGLVLLFLGVAQPLATTGNVQGETTTCPDLFPEIQITPRQPAVDQLIDVSVTVTNIGTERAGGFPVHLYINPADQPPLPATADFRRTRSLSLQPGKKFTWGLPGEISFDTPGQHVIYVWVDRDNEVPNECSEENNVIMEIIQVGDGLLCQPDSYESGAGDNSCQNAPLISTDGSVRRHNLCPVGDQDWVRFEGQAGIQYEILADNVEKDARLNLLLYEICGQESVQKEDATLGSGVRLEVSAPETAIYFLKVQHHDESYGPQTGYDLSIRAQCSIDAYEPDGRCTFAREIYADGRAQQRSFCSPADEDWLVLHTVAGTAYEIQTRNWESGSHPVMESRASCAAQQGTKSAPRESLQWTATATGPVYFRITNQDAGQHGLQSGYEVIVEAKKADPQPQEPGNTPAQAHEIAPDGQAQQHHIDQPGDEDWFVFSAVAGRSYRIETFDLAPSVDTLLCLYSNSGQTLVACDDDSGGDAGSRLLWRADRSGRYHVRVRDQVAAAGGPQASYQIAIKASESACDPDQWEPDNLYQQASRLNVGEEQVHTFCAGDDVDWVRFWIQEPGVYQLQAVAEGANADPVVTLYDQGGTSLLFSNDDYGPGLSSRILWRFQQSGDYYAQIRSFDGQASGRGTEYRLQLTRSNVTPTPLPVTPPTPTPTPTVTPTPTATPTATPLPLATTPVVPPRTLIVTSERRLAALYGSEAAAAVMAKVQALAAYGNAPGLILNLDRFYSIQSAYDQWDSQATSVPHANAVADAIRSLIWAQITLNPQIQYLVIVGEDRVVPYRRVADHLDRVAGWKHFEDSYEFIDPATAIGQALRQNHSLSDSFYAARDVRSLQETPLYLPDIAVGRLVETPGQMMSSIESFLENDQLSLSAGFVAGSQNRQLPAHRACEMLKVRLGETSTQCSTSGHWTTQDFLNTHLRGLPAGSLHLLYLRGSHWQALMHDGGIAYSSDLTENTSALNRSLVFSLVSHGGLNLASPNPHELDWPQAYAQTGSLFMGFSGDAFYYREGESGLSDRLVERFVDLISTSQVLTVGEAWQHALHHYWQESQGVAKLIDRKVVHGSIFYGIPMYRIPTSFQTVNEFPSVIPSTGAQSRRGATLFHQLNLKLSDGFVWQSVGDNPSGDYFTLDGHVHWAPNEAGQPLYYLDLGVTDIGDLLPARGLLWRSAAYTDLADFNPLIPRIAVEDQTVQLRQGDATAPPEPPRQWNTLVPAQLDTNGNRLAIHWGQFHEESRTQRLYNGFRFDLTFSRSPDRDGPIVHHASASNQRGKAQVKVEASDPSGVTRVLVVYTDGLGEWRSFDLTYHPEMAKWIGQIPTEQPVLWFAQVVDGVGNVTNVSNKGNYFHLRLVEPQAPARSNIYLPALSR